MGIQIFNGVRNRWFAGPFYISSFVLMLTGSCFSQYMPNVVFWSDNLECGNKKLVAENRSKYVCSTEKQTDGTVRIVKTDEITLKILPVYYRNTVSLRTIIENKSDKKIRSDFTAWTTAHYASEGDFLSGKAPIANETYLRPTPQSIAVPTTPSDPFGTAPTRTIKTVGNTHDAKNPTQLPTNQQQTVVLPTTGNVGTSSTGPGPIAVRVSTSGQGGVMTQGEFIVKRLNERSVDKYETINGTVPFNRYGGAPFKLAFLHVGDTTFVFPIW